MYVSRDSIVYHWGSIERCLLIWFLNYECYTLLLDAIIYLLLWAIWRQGNQRILRDRSLYLRSCPPNWREQKEKECSLISHQPSWSWRSSVLQTGSWTQSILHVLWEDSVGWFRLMQEINSCRPRNLIVVHLPMVDTRTMMALNILNDCILSEDLCNCLQKVDDHQTIPVAVKWIRNTSSHLYATHTYKSSKSCELMIHFNCSFKLYSGTRTSKTRSCCSRNFQEWKSCSRAGIYRNYRNPLASVGVDWNTSRHAYLDTAIARELTICDLTALDSQQEGLFL